jgi:hypothetical protein
LIKSYGPEMAELPSTPDPSRGRAGMVSREHQHQWSGVCLGAYCIGCGELRHQERISAARAQLVATDYDDHLLRRKKPQPNPKPRRGR